MSKWTEDEIRKHEEWVDSLSETTTKQIDIQTSIALCELLGLDASRVTKIVVKAQIGKGLIVEIRQRKEETEK